jgi:hypothetical protein
LRLSDEEEDEKAEVVAEDAVAAAVAEGTEETEGTEEEDGGAAVMRAPVVLLEDWRGGTWPAEEEGTLTGTEGILSGSAALWSVKML